MNTPNHFEYITKISTYLTYYLKLKILERKREAGRSLEDLNVLKILDINSYHNIIRTDLYVPHIRFIRRFLLENESLRFFKNFKKS